MKYVTVIILMIGCYVGAYGWLVEHDELSEEQEDTYITHKIPSYGGDLAMVHYLFAPLHALDRRIRSDYWASRNTEAFRLTEDVQYFSPGPEFKLVNEAAAMKAAQEEQAKIIEEDAKTPLK